MLEDVYETVRGLIFTEFPQNSSGLPCIYDLPIKKYYFGEHDLTGIDTPSILIKGETSAPKDKTFGAREYEHTITIECYVQKGKREAGERNAQEASRLLNNVFNKHRRLWVIGICPICLKSSLSPEHFVIDHNDILSTYATAAQTAFDAVWATTHTSTSPELADSVISATAFLNMFDSVVDASTPVISNLSAESRARILSYKEKDRKPVRLLYDVAITDSKPSNGGAGQQLLYMSTLTLRAKELVRISEYGPDNVSTDAWERR